LPSKESKEQVRTGTDNLVVNVISEPQTGVKNAENCLASCLLSQCGKERISANNLEQKKAQKGECQNAFKTPLDASKTHFSEQKPHNAEGGN
jgi:hypothetical protein